MKRKLYLMIACLVWPLLWAGNEVNAMSTDLRLAKQSASVALTAESITSFVDEYMATQMTSSNVPGAAIVVVQGEAVLLAKGYGMADLDADRPVVVDETLFRAGSVSKLFTATAVMQLVEQGRIGLDDDINQHLTSLQLPDKFDRPLTVADLLQHTTGLDDVFFGMHERDAEDVESLADFLGHHLPERYDPPGELISYNDHGYTLVGLLIEDVTGQSFVDYMAAHVLGPLQMGSSSFAQPLPADLQTQVAVGYRYEEQFEPYEFDYVNIGPAAGLHATASDMAHFVMAHLNNGRYGEQQVLQPETVSQMQATQFSHHPVLRGRGYGFAEWHENGLRAVFHDGGNPGFLNRLFLIPEEGIGFYLTFNGDQYAGASQFHREFTTRFMDEFYPETEETVVLPTAVPLGRPASDLTGYYRDVSAHSHDTFQKLTSLMNQFPVRMNG